MYKNGFFFGKEQTKYVKLNTKICIYFDEEYQKNIKIQICI